MRSLQNVALHEEAYVLAQCMIAHDDLRIAASIHCISYRICRIQDPTCRMNAYTWKVLMCCIRSPHILQASWVRNCVPENGSKYAVMLNVQNVIV
jgi:hypothetical protein